jgi:hypothetical protein
MTVYDGSLRFLPKFNHISMAQHDPPPNTYIEHFMNGASGQTKKGAGPENLWRRPPVYSLA